MRVSLKSLLSLNNQKGFSLTEVMVGGGILAGVALAGAQMFKDQKTAQKKIEHDLNLAIYHNNLAKKIGMAANCNATLKSAYYNQASISGNIPTLQTCTGGCADNNSGSGLAYDASNISSMSTELTTVLGGGTGWIDNTQVWRADSVTVVGSVTRSGKLTLRVQYSLNPNKFTQKTVTKDINLNVRFNGGTFKECLDAQESNINNLQKDICKSLNYNEQTGMIDTNGKMAYWDDVAQTCKVTGQKDCSAPGMMVQGVRSDGSVHCKPISDWDQGQSINGATTQNCAGGKKPHVQYNSTNKKVEIICQ